MRNDHDVLDLLSFHEAQNLGSEILLPIRPAQAAACDGSGAQVDALEAWRMDEDLGEGPGCWQPRDVPASQFECDGFRRTLFLIALVEVGPKSCVDKSEEVSQDSVVVEQRDLVEL